MRFSTRRLRQRPQHPAKGLSALTQAAALRDMCLTPPPQRERAASRLPLTRVRPQPPPKPKERCRSKPRGLYQRPQPPSQPANYGTEDTAIGSTSGFGINRSAQGLRHGEQGESGVLPAPSPANKYTWVCSPKSPPVLRLQLFKGVEPNT